MSVEEHQNKVLSYI